MKTTYNMDYFRGNTIQMLWLGLLHTPSVQISNTICIHMYHALISSAHDELCSLTASLGKDLHSPRHWCGKQLSKTSFRSTGKTPICIRSLTTPHPQSTRATKYTTNNQKYPPKAKKNPNPKQTTWGTEVSFPHFQSCCSFLLWVAIDTTGKQTADKHAVLSLASSARAKLLQKYFWRCPGTRLKVTYWHHWTLVTQNTWYPC